MLDGCKIWKNGLDDGMHQICFMMCSLNSSINETFLQCHCITSGKRMLMHSFHTLYCIHCTKPQNILFSKCKNWIHQYMKRIHPFVNHRYHFALQLRSHSLKYEMVNKWGDSSTMHTFPWRSLWIWHHTSLQCSIY